MFVSTVSASIVLDSPVLHRYFDPKKRHCGLVDCSAARRSSRCARSASMNEHASVTVLVETIKKKRNPFAGTCAGRYIRLY